MISIESYRAAIGKFYSKAVCCPIKKFKFHQQQKQNNTKHNRDAFGKYLMFEVYFKILFALAIISAPISLDLSVVFLKLLLLLLAGDVETNPGPVIDIQLLTALTESYEESVMETNRRLLCDTILAQARSIGLHHLVADELTISDGNCFYHAIVQQLNRPEIQERLPPNFQSITDYDRLRKDVVNFVRENVNTIPLFERFCHFGYSSLEVAGRTWDQMLSTQERSTEYAEELFIRATAIMLNIPILITSDRNTEQDPYTYISNSPEDQVDANNRQLVQDLINNESAVYLCLGSQHARHFQSLLSDRSFSTTVDSACQSERSQTSSGHPSSHKRSEYENPCTSSILQSPAKLCIPAENDQFVPVSEVLQEKVAVKSPPKKKQ